MLYTNIFYFIMTLYRRRIKCKDMPSCMQALDQEGPGYDKALTLIKLTIQYEITSLSTYCSSAPIQLRVSVVPLQELHSLPQVFNLPLSHHYLSTDIYLSKCSIKSALMEFAGSYQLLLKRWFDLCIVMRASY